MLLHSKTHGQVAHATISVHNARRMFLHAQGILDDPERRGAASTASVAKLIERIGFVQIDTINVVERAHHLILATRIDDYDRSTLDTLQGPPHHRLFEHWTHDASYIPTTWFAHWRHRFERYRANAWHAQRMGDNADQALADVLGRVRREGPLRSKDFE